MEYTLSVDLGFTTGYGLGTIEGVRAVQALRALNPIFVQLGVLSSLVLCEIQVNIKG